MSNIRFTMKDLDGTVMPYTSFVISTSASANAASFTTNLNGEATVTLAAVSTPYYISKQDGTTESVIAYKFFVPESVVTLEAEMLFVDMGKISTDKNTKSIAALIEAKVVAVNARNESFKLAQILGVITNIENSLENVTRVKESIDKVDRVYSSIAKVDRVFISIGNLDRMYASIDKLDRVYASIDKLDGVYTGINNVDVVSTNITNVNKTAVIDAHITKVANIDANVTKVANIDTSVTKVANIDTAVTKVANIDNDVTLLNTIVISYLGKSSSAPATRIGGSAIQIGDWYIDSSVTPHQIKVCSAINSGTPSFVFIKNMDAEAAKVAAELARDAALIGAGVYATEAAGRAAVADGAPFLVQGTGEAAALLYRRFASGSSTYITTYPSLAGTLAIDASKRTAHIGKNHFNPADKNVAAGYTVNGATGELTATAGFTVTGFIPVTAGVTYTASQGRGYAWFDASRIYISGATPSISVPLTVTAPAGAAYFRTSSAGGHLSAFQFEIGNSATQCKTYTEEPALQADVVGTAAVLRRSITPDRVSFISAGKNKFDKDSATIGQYITSAGVLGENATYDTSDYIAVTAGTAYKSSHNIRFSCYFDSDMSVVAGGITADSTTFTVPAGVSFVRVSMYHANLSAFQLELGATATVYESFRWINDLTAPSADGAITTQKLAQAAVTPEKTSFFVPSRNLFDKSEALLGYYLSNAGVLSESASYEVSDHIAITPGSTYSLSPAAGVRFTCYFDALFNVVAGGSSTAGVSSFTAPAGAVWVRITVFQTSHDTFQFEAGARATAFVPFGSSLDTSVLPAPELVAPPAVFGVMGRECNVYFDNLHIARSTDYEHDVTSVAGSGTHKSECWTWTPGAALTGGSLVIAAHNKQTGAVVSTATIAQRAAASSAGSGTTKKVLVIGDSLVNASVITQTLIDVAATDVMGVTLLGTRGTGSNKHEGRGGWTLAAYTSNYSDGTVGANPFWISGAVNFPQYLTNNSIAVPDWVAIHLGINDVFGQTTDAGAISTATTAFAALDTLITSIKAAGAGVKVALMLPTPPASSQDAFGASYGTGQTRWRFKRNIMLWTQTLITRYAGQEANRIYIAPTNTAIDTTNNVSYAAVAPVNSRSSVSVVRQNNGVHPADSGYQQIGDALWAFLKYYAEV